MKTQLTPACEFLRLRDSLRQLAELKQVLVAKTFRREWFSKMIERYTGNRTVRGSVYSWTMSKVVISGSLAYDRIMDFDGLFADHFVPDKLHSISISFLIQRLSVGFGGTAGNIAYTLALLQARPEIIATAGEDFSSYRAHLLLSGVEPTTVRVLEGELTSSAFVFTDKADNQIAAFHPGAGGHAYADPVETDGRALAIVAAGCIADMKALPKLYRDRKLPYLYDPGQALTALSGEDILAGMMGAKALFGSDYEFGLMSQKTGLTEQAMLEHVSALVVTHGSEGSRIVTREGETRVKVAAVKDVVDPTGAGDAYRAGFIKGYLQGLPLETCAKIASTAASYTVEMYGTQTHRFTLAEFAERYKQSYGETITL